MSFPYFPRMQDVKVESLQTQLEHLNLLRRRHLHWMTLANDPRVEGLHADIAVQIEEITAKYNGLLDELQRESDPASKVSPYYKMQLGF